MKVLVTGASGFVGGWLVRRLLDEGVSVRILKRSEGESGDLRGLKFETAIGDIKNEKSLIEACREIDSVFHLAGLVAYSRTQRKAMEQINVGGTRNVLSACEKAGVRRLVHLSSVVAIGASFDGKRPLNENSEYNLTHLDLGYFETKRQAEILVREAAQDRRVDAVILNPSTIYGPRDARKGSRDSQLKVARGQLAFYPPGGVNVIAVEDVMDAVIAAWKKGRSGERYIVCGENLLIKDVFDIIAAEARVRPPRIALPRQALFAVGKIGDVLEAIGRRPSMNTERAWTSILFHWFDGTKAKIELGISPKPAAEAIAESVRWMADNGLLEKY